MSQAGYPRHRCQLGIGYDMTAALVASPENHVIMGCRNYERGTRALCSSYTPSLTRALSAFSRWTLPTTRASAWPWTSSRPEFGVVLTCSSNNAGIVMRNFADRRSEILDTLNTTRSGHLVLPKPCAAAAKIN
ncbi:hypothetical protein J3459_010890 [Metarhizium acridum]|nr:hypothetical protein J3459_010890 [Metarhizium acridum]